MLSHTDGVVNFSKKGGQISKIAVYSDGLVCIPVGAEHSMMPTQFVQI